MRRGFLALGMMVAVLVPGRGEERKIVRKVNGVPVYAEGAGFLLQAMRQEGLEVSLSGLGTELVTVEILRQAAVAKGLDKDPQVRSAMRRKGEWALANACMAAMLEKVPAAGEGELEAAMAWAKQHALVQYEFYRATAGTREGALRMHDELAARLARNESVYHWQKAFWALTDDADRPRNEWAPTRTLVAANRPGVSEIFPSRDGYTFLEYSGRSRKVDPLLQDPLDDYSLAGSGEEGSPRARFVADFMPRYRLWQERERWRKAEGYLPWNPGPYPAQYRELQEAVDQRLLAAEAQRRGLDQEAWVKEGVAVAQSWALVRAYHELQLGARPLTEAELQKAYEEAFGGPLEYQVHSYGFAQEAKAKEALEQLRAGKTPESLENIDWYDPASLRPELGDLLRNQAKDVWPDQPILLQAEGRKAYILARWTERRRAAGFDRAYRGHREFVLEELRQRRWLQLVKEAWGAAKIE